MSPAVHRLALLLAALAALSTSTAETKPSLHVWLEDMGEGTHAAAFEAKGFSTVEELISSGLEEADLAQLGLSLKARRRISKALRNLANPTQNHPSHSSPLVNGAAAKRGAASTASSVSGRAGKWPTPSALRRFIDPADAPPPGRNGGIWDISGVTHPGSEALTTLSTEPRLEQWDGFFSSDEVDVLLNALSGDSTTGPDSWMPRWSHHDYKYSASGEAKLYLKYLHPSLGDYNRSEPASILLRAEERIAAWTGVRWEDFTGFQVRDEWEHVPAPGVALSVLASKPPCSPVHVDNHKAPARVSTSIIYLTTLSSGATVFPCILPKGTKKSVVKQRRKHCVEAAQRGAVTNYDHSQGDPFGLLGLAGAVCNGTAPGLAVMPKAGRAVTFYAKEKAVPNFLLWHAGCHLFPALVGDRTGASTSTQSRIQNRKVTIQKFKEAAPVVRFSKSQGSEKDMLQSDFGQEWVKADTDRDDAVTVQELEQLWIDTLEIESKRGGGGWFRESDGPHLDKASLHAKTQELVAQLDVDRNGRLGLVEWTVQHAIIEAFLNSRRYALK